MVNPKSNLGIVETKYLELYDILLENGQRFSPVKIAYETYGELNPEKSNAILVLHALSGDAHAAGIHSHNDKKPGWWDEMIGPGKAFDTDKYFIICSNVFGGCKGTTGPASVDHRTNKPYGLGFPLVGIYDMVNCQKQLVEHFGIKKLLSVVGGSMGGLQVIGWMTKYPKMIASAIPIAACLRHNPQQIAFNEVGRQAIMADEHWKEGDYYGGTLPAKGLAVARMLGHITYMSDISMAEKFGRQKKHKDELFQFNAPNYEVESYLHYHGDNFVKRFDANSYLYITRAMDNFDPLAGGTLRDLFKGLQAKVLVVAFKSDWLYPAYQSKEIVKACKLSGVEATFCEVDSKYGHDAFLLETKEETHLISHFLKKVFYAYEVTGNYGL